MSDTDDAREAYEDLPVESIIALNTAVNHLAKVPDPSNRLQFVSDAIVKYLKGEEPSLDQAFGGKYGKGNTAINHAEAAETSVAKETEVQRWVAAAIELLQSVPVEEDKPSQPVPKHLVAVARPGLSAADTEASSFTAGNTVIAAASNNTRNPSRKSPLASIAVVVAGLVILMGAIGYFLTKEKLLTDHNDSVATSTVHLAVIASKSASAPVVTASPLVSVPSSPELPPPVPSEERSALPRQAAQVIMPVEKREVPTLGSPAMKSAPPPKHTAHVERRAGRSAGSRASVDPSRLPMQAKGNGNRHQVPFRLSLAMAPLRLLNTIDEQYKVRAAKECRDGVLGLFCREAIRLKLCRGKWADDPPRGQTQCKKNNTQKR